MGIKSHSPSCSCHGHPKIGILAAKDKFYSIFLNVLSFHDTKMKPVMVIENLQHRYELAPAMTHTNSKVLEYRIEL